MKRRTVILGAGAMASSCAYDLHLNSDFEEIIIADINRDFAERVISLMDGDKRFSYVRVDAADKEDLVSVLKDAQYCVNGLPYHFDDFVLEALRDDRIKGLKMVDVNGSKFDKLFALSPELRDKDCAIFVANGGLVTTTLMAATGCEEMDEVDEVNFYWGMWRPITHTNFGLAETATSEHDPRTDERVIWQDGEVIRNFPPFALCKDWEFPQPIGLQEVYLITHSEPITFPLAPVAKAKKVKRVTARGLWHHAWTRYERVLLETGIFEAEPIEISGVQVSPLEVIQKTIVREGQEEWGDPYELAREIGWEPQAILSTEVIGYKKGRGHRIVYHSQSPYPFFQGKPVTPSMEYGSYVGVPCSLTLQMLANEEITTRGIFTVETSDICSATYFERMKARGFRFTTVHSKTCSDKEVVPEGRRNYRSMAGL